MALGLIMGGKSEPLGDPHKEPRLLRVPRASLPVPTRPHATSTASSTLLKQLPPTPDCVPEPTKGDIELFLQKLNCRIFFTHIRVGTENQVKYNFLNSLFGFLSQLASLLTGLNVEV